jgi:Flp pilus assembly protein TadG
MASIALRRLRRSERGAELVEFAIVVPVLLLLLGGIIDFALLFQSYEVSTNAAREGARLAVLPGYQVNDYAPARNRVATYMQAGGARGTYTTAVTPLPLTACGTPGSGVRVTVTYTHDFAIVGPVVGLINGTFDDSLTFSTSSLMRSEIQTFIPCP